MAVSNETGDGLEVRELQMIRYEKLGFVELTVTDLARSKDFYHKLVGLEPAPNGPSGEVRFRCSDDPYSVVLHQGELAGFKRVGWMLESEAEFDNVYRALRNARTAWEELSKDECEGRLFKRACRMVEPNTRAVQEFYIPLEQTKATPWTPTLAKIKGLGHIAWRTPRKDEAVAYFRDVLNFKESDSIGSIVTFFRCFPNPFHHGMGVARSSEYGHHHLNFMVTEIDDIGRALHRINANNVPLMKGPGRHPASGSVFLYFLDPDGLTLEYSYGMEEFDEFSPRPPRTLPLVPESTDTWNAPIDPRYAKMGITETYEIPSS